MIHRKKIWGHRTSKIYKSRQSSSNGHLPIICLFYDLPSARAHAWRGMWICVRSKDAQKQSAIRKKMATGTLTYNALRTKILKLRIKRKTKKNCKSFRLDKSNAVNVGTTAVKPYRSIYPVGLVWFARYCSKMYSRHLFFLRWISANVLNCDVKSSLLTIGRISSEQLQTFLRLPLFLWTYCILPNLHHSLVIAILH